VVEAGDVALVGMERMPSSMVVADWLRRLAGVELRGTERGGWEEGLKKVRGTMGYYGFMDRICVMAELEPGNHSPNDHVAERAVWLCRLRRGAPLCPRAIVLRPRVWRSLFPHCLPCKDRPIRQHNDGAYTAGVKSVAGTGIHPVPATQ